MNEPLFALVVHIKVENELVHEDNVVVGVFNKEGIEINIVVEILALLELLKDDYGLCLM